MNEAQKSGGWAGWIYFAGLMMLMVGLFQAVAGFVALFKEDVYLVGGGQVAFFDYSEWGWIHLTWGIIVALSSFSLMAGQMWGRILAVFLAIMSAMANFAFLPAYPIWSTIIITIDILIIYAITVHGKELKAS